jgi:hypothetical protein
LSTEHHTQNSKDQGRRPVNSRREREKKREREEEREGRKRRELGGGQGSALTLQRQGGLEAKSR